MNNGKLFIQDIVSFLAELVPDIQLSFNLPAPKGRRHDSAVQLVIGKTIIQLTVEVKQSSKRIVLGQLFNQLTGSENPTLLTDYVGPKWGETLRQHAINYIDTAGNTYLRFDHLPFLIWIEGRKIDRRNDAKADHAFTKAGLRVTYWLLTHADQANETIRTIAKEAGTSLETVHRVKASLQQCGFLMEVRKGKWRLVNRKTLLDKWIEAYATRLRPSLLRGRYRRLKNETLGDWDQQPLEAPMTQWGGEAAADSLTRHIRPDEWTVYTRQSTQTIIKQLRLLPDAEKGPVYLYEKFWPHDEAGSMVHPLLVYADMLISQDARNREVAQKLYKSHVQLLLDGASASAI